MAPRIERLRSRENIPDPETSAGKYLLERKDELDNILAEIDPFHNNKQGEKYLEVVGQGVLPITLETFSEQFLQQVDAKSLSRSFRYQSNKLILEIRNRLLSHAKEEETHTNPPTEPLQGSLEESSDFGETDSQENSDDLIFASKRLGFLVVMNEISSSVLTIHNTGTSAYHFEWVRVDTENQLRTCACKDGIQRFYMSRKKGIILPNTSFDFVIIFKSQRPGMFSETWKLLTSPMNTNVENTVEFFGTAFEVNNSMESRRNIDQMLEKKVANTLAKDIIEDLLHMLPTKKPILFAALDGEDLSDTEYDPDEQFNSSEERRFIAKNVKLKVLQWDLICSFIIRPLLTTNLRNWPGKSTKYCWKKTASGIVVRGMLA